jgi:hypothetical protein
MKTDDITVMKPIRIIIHAGKPKPVGIVPNNKAIEATTKA